MHSKAKPPTKYERERMSRFLDVGCVACWLKGLRTEPQCHHLLSGGKRRGHRYTVPLCPWHHEGIPFGTLTILEMDDQFGPSLAHTPRRFTEAFGDDDSLLELTDQLVEKEMARKV